MKVKAYLPADPLKPFISTFLIIESEDGSENTLLPDTSIVMAFRYKGSIADRVNGTAHDLPASVISGLRKSSRLLDYAKGTGNLLVIFREGGASVFFKEPLHELFNASISLENLNRYNQLNEIEERLTGAKNALERISMVEKFLFSRLKEPRPDPLVLHAIRRIKSADGGMRIKDLITGLNISQDPFEKRFRRATGTSPKQFSTIVRLRNLIYHYPQAENLTDAAHTAGYFDQAHFIKDFKSFTGQTPQTFFRSPSFW